MDKIWDIFKEEEKKNTLGSNFGGGWDLSSLKPKEEEKAKSPVWDIFEQPTVEAKPTQFGTGAKAVGGATLPEPEQPTNVGEMFTPEGIAGRLKSKTYRTGETEISELTKPKEITKPEDLKMGIDVALGTWEEQKAANPELQKTEDLAKEVLSLGGKSNPYESIGVIGANYTKKEAQIAYVYELLTATETEAGVPFEETIKDIQANKEKYGSINPPVDWKKSWEEEGKLKTIFIGPSTKYGQAESMLRGFEDILIKKENPGADRLSSMGFKGIVLLMGAQAVAGAIEITPKIWNKLKVKVVDKKIPYQETVDAFKRVGHGKGTAYDKRIFDEVILRADNKNIDIKKIFKEGISITDVQPRFAFGGTKLYAGLPADEIAKSIVEVGKVTAEAIKGIDPAKAIQTYQMLMNTSPALASEFLKAVEKPEGIEEAVEPKVEKLGEKFTGKAFRAETAIPEHGADVISKMETAQEKLDYDYGTTANYVFKEAGELAKNVGIDLKKVPVQDMVWVANDLETANKYGEGKEIQLPEDTIILAKDEEGGSLVLKNADKYIKGKPTEFAEVGTPEAKMLPEGERGVTPTIPTELEGLAEEARKYKSVEEFENSLVIKDKDDNDLNDLFGRKPMVNPDGTLTVYHATTLENAKKIEKTGIKDAKEIEGGEVYFSTKPKGGIGFGDYVIEMKIKPSLLLLDDAFRDGELHLHANEKDLLENKVISINKVEDVKNLKPFLAEDFYTQATTGKATEPKVAPTKAEVKVEEPKVDLATPVQIKKAHAIANTKAMISEKGKVKPQYRAVAKAFTGKTSIKDMTPEEAEMFIDQLNRLPEPKYRNGKLVAPTIPRTMKLTTEDFFKKQYGEPTPIWLLTDQTYYATKLGIKPLVAPFEIGKQEFDLEFRKSSNLVDRMVNKLNQVAKTPIQERLKTKVKNIPTKAESKMAELLNKHEATPTGLSPKEEDIFRYFRNLSKDIWRRENEVREKLDLPAIKYKTAYFRHTADAMAKEILEGKYPFPEGVKYWSEKIVGKKIFNPMEFHRKLSDDLIDIWSKDIRAVTKAMLWNGLKEIHLAEPSKFLNEQLNAISKDLPEYKNLTPAEQVAYDQTKVMPASTKKWLINYVNQVIKGQENELDASLNRIVTKSGLKGIFDKVLSPFGRAVGRKPITNIFALSGRMVISGVMGWVPRQIIRNAFQQVQNLALYGINSTAKAFLPASVDKNLKGLLSESLFMKSYTGFEELPADVMGKLEKAWLYPYGVIANNNAKQGMKAAYWNILELIKNPKFKKYGWADPQRTKDTPKGLLYPSEKEKLLKEMEFGASATQYQYIPMGMPGVFRYKALIPLTRLQSWWMNYFTKFNREAIHRGLKGRPSWSGEDGPTLPWSRRVNWLKYLIIGGGILTAMGYKRSFMVGVLPAYISPAGQVALGFYNYATATSDWKKKMALNQIYYSWKAFIPGSLAWRDFLAVWNGEKELNEILFYGKKEEKKSTVPKSGIWEEMEGKKKTTKSDIWETFEPAKSTKSDVWEQFND